MTHTEGEKRRSDERVPPTGLRFDHKEWETSRYARIQGWSLQSPNALRDFISDTRVSKYIYKISVNE